MFTKRHTRKNKQKAKDNESKKKELLKKWQ